MSVYCHHLFHYWLSPETFGYTLVHILNIMFIVISQERLLMILKMLQVMYCLMTKLLTEHAKYCLYKRELSIQTQASSWDILQWSWTYWLYGRPNMETLGMMFSASLTPSYQAVKWRSWYKIWGFHGLLGCYTQWCGRIQTFQRPTLPPPSGWSKGGTCTGTGTVIGCIVANSLSQLVYSGCSALCGLMTTFGF